MNNKENLVNWKLRDNINLKPTFSIAKLHQAKADKLSKSDETGQSFEKAYQTPQALGKAVGKVKGHLLASPGKRKAVVSKLASLVGMSVAKRKTFSNGNKCLSPHIVQQVKSFYQRDSISRQSAGIKEFVLCWNGGKKTPWAEEVPTVLSKRSTCSFREEYPNFKIGFSKFCSMRPSHVLLYSTTPRSVCCCEYHENIKLLRDCLSKEIDGFPVYSNDLVNELVCNIDSEECMFGRCTKCPNWLQTFKDNKLTNDNAITWYQWESVDVEVASKSKKGQTKSTKKTMKVCHDSTVRDALAVLDEKLPSFLQHVYIKGKQSSYFQETLANFKYDECVLQVDFGKNYSCINQDEIQAAHWNAQVTLFTVGIWTKAEGGNVFESYVIVSDDTDHDNKSVTAFLWYIVNEFVMKKHQNIKTLYAFSDGPSSQFKNRYIVNFLHKVKKLINIQWNYFATAHGKGS
ncbi:hypothetical protein AC249_AIPGENE8686 [Exaiptasia diaphana]|nr:hypothetical protein AC249_AIPGENE8686 [Exaiptasia diaphana]